MTARRIDADVALEIEGRLIRGETPAQVERGMLREAGFAGRIPTLRTIQRMARDLTPDTSDEWHLSPEERDAAGAILWVLAASLQDGWKVPITVREARWCETVRGIAWDLGPLTVRYMARLFLAAEARGDSTAWLDAALAIAPWRGPTQRAAYEALGLPPLPFAATAAQAKR